MSITQFITFLEGIKKEKGEIEVLGYVKTGWYISAMGGGELTRGNKAPSKYHKYVVALQTDSSFQRD